jgi:hypothetical protein
MTAFMERTLGTERHSSKTVLPNTNHSAKPGTRQRAVSSRLYLTAVIFAEYRSLTLGKEASLPSVLRLTLGRACCAECHSWTLGKIFFYFFSNQTFCAIFLRYIDLHVPFGITIKVFSITIRFSSFNWISSENSYLNCKSLEIWKIMHAKMICMLFHKLRPISITDRNLGAPCSLNMTLNLPSSCLKIV